MGNFLCSANQNNCLLCLWETPCLLHRKDTELCWTLYLLRYSDSLTFCILQQVAGRPSSFICLNYFPKSLTFKVLSLKLSMPFSVQQTPNLSLQLIPVHTQCVTQKRIMWFPWSYPLSFKKYTLWYQFLRLAKGVEVARNKVIITQRFPSGYIAHSLLFAQILKGCIVCLPFPYPIDKMPSG